MIKIVEIKKVLVLSKTKYLSFKEIQTFIFSIIVLSTLFTVSSSFLLGFSSQDIFVSETEENILIITEPKITPSQSRIPLYWVQDILELSGVITVSPETIDVIIDHTNSETPFFRGVTQDFKETKSEFQILNGHWFDISSSNTNSKNEIMIGSSYAKLLGINIGDKLVLQSRTRFITFDVLVVGIFQTKTVADDGLLGPLWMGKIFGGVSETDVNLIRVKFNPEIQSKSILKSIILEKHLLNVNIIGNENISIKEGLKVDLEVFSRYKEKIKVIHINESNNVNILLPFGKYYLRLNSELNISKKFISIFLIDNRTTELFLFERKFNFMGEFSISNNLVTNARIFIENIDLNENLTFYTNTDGIIESEISQGLLKISLYWKSYTNSTFFNHFEENNIKINFDFLAQFEIKETNSHSSVPFINAKVRNLLSNESFLVKGDLNGKLTFLALPSTPYEVELTNSEFGRIFTLNEFNKTLMTKYIGYSTLIINVIDLDIGKLSDIEINITINNNFYKYTNSTTQIINNEGIIEIKDFSGSEIIISAKYGPNNELYVQKIILEDFESFNFYLGNQEYFLKFKNNFFLNSQEDLTYSLVIINLNTSHIINEIITSNSVKKIVIPYGNYSIKLFNSSFIMYNEFNFNNSLNNVFEINLKLFTVNITITKLNKELFSGAFVLYKNVDHNFEIIQEFNTPIISTLLFNGLYKLILDDDDYKLNFNFVIFDEQLIKTLEVIEFLPEISLLNSQLFKNKSMIKSSQIIYLNYIHTDSIYYKWDIESFNPYDNSTGLIVPKEEGLHKLDILGSNSENKSIFLTYQWYVDDSGIILSLLNEENNSIINYIFEPEFSYSETPSKVIFRWNTTNINKSTPSEIPNFSNEVHELFVELTDYAGNINTFIFIFTLDLIIPEIENFFNINNSIIYNLENLELNFTEEIEEIQYYWNEGIFQLGSNLIPIPDKDSINNYLFIKIKDFADNWNNYTFYFPIIDNIAPTFIISNIENNTQINQKLNAKINFNVKNHNGTLFYRWNSTLKWNSTSITNLGSLILEIYDGLMKLEIMLFDEFNLIHNVSKTYFFNGNFTQPQFNVSINSPIVMEPNQPILIEYHDYVLNWSYNWNSGINQTGNSNSTIITTPITLDFHILKFYLENSSGFTFTEIYNISITNRLPILNKNNLSYISSIQNLIVTFPEYIDYWNYSWNYQSAYSGLNLSSKVIIPDYLSGNNVLIINYTTNSSVTNSFIFEYFIDNEPPQIILLNTKNESVHKSGDIISLKFNETILSAKYSWNNNENISFSDPKESFQNLTGMPSGNSAHILTIYVWDLAYNLNITKYLFFEDNSNIEINLDPQNASINSVYVDSSQFIKFLTNETPNKIYCSWGNNIYLECDLIVPIINFYGEIHFSIKIVDVAGNENIYELILKSDNISPVIIFSSIQNGSIITAETVFEFKFSEEVFSNSSIYSWDGYNNNTGFPKLNQNMMGNYNLQWLFSDLNNNLVFYTFSVYIDNILPEIKIIGNYSSNVIQANSSIKILKLYEVEKIDHLFYRWNNNSLYQTIIGSYLTLPPTLGINLLYLFIKDNVGNWNNLSYNFNISLFLSLNLLSFDQISLPNISILLKEISSGKLIYTSTNYKINNFINPGTYLIHLVFTEFNLTSKIIIDTTSRTKLIYLKQYLINFFNINENKSEIGYMNWNSSLFSSTSVFINGSKIIYAEQGNVTFNTSIDNNTYYRQSSSDIFIQSINFTSKKVKLKINVLVDKTFIPIKNVEIYINEILIGKTNLNGNNELDLNPGKYEIIISYKDQTKSKSIELFENLELTFLLLIKINLTIQIISNNRIPVENALILVYGIDNSVAFSGISNLYGEIKTIGILIGFYKIEVNYLEDKFLIDLGILNPNLNYKSVLIPISLTNFTEIGSNFGRWSNNRDYQLLGASELSENVVNNLGFSWAAFSLFLIILLMTILGLMAILHHPIFVLKDTIKILRYLGAEPKQIKISLTIQLSIITSIITLFGSFIGFLILNTIPSFQVISVAGMIINPVTNDFVIPLSIFISFGLFSSVFIYKYINLEYFNNNLEKKNEVNHL